MACIPKLLCSIPRVSCRRTWITWDFVPLLFTSPFGWSRCDLLVPISGNVNVTACLVTENDDVIYMVLCQLLCNRPLRRPGCKAASNQVECLLGPVVAEKCSCNQTLQCLLWTAAMPWKSSDSQQIWIFKQLCCSVWLTQSQSFFSPFCLSFSEIRCMSLLYKKI